eukprot:jgi/Tetstr1/446422/TSEL_033964.t1
MIDIYQIPGILRKRIGWLFVLPAVMTTLALGFLALKTPQYSASAELLIEPRGLQIVGNDILARDNGDALQRLAVDSQTYVILSQAVLEDVVERLDLTDDPAITKLPGGGLLSRLLGRGAPTPTEEDIRAAAIAGLKDRLQAVRVEKAFVINIIMRHPDRFAAAAIANEAARAYLDEARRSRADATLRASVALQEQAADLKTRVEAAEAAVETFRAENGLISTGQRGLVVDQQLQDINTQLTQARVDLERAKSNADLLKTLTVTDIEAGGLPANLQTTTLGSLRVQFARIAEREAQAATTLGANHPQLRELRSQLDNTRRLIADELSRSRSQIRLRQLENEASSLGAVYNSFLSRANELQEQQEIDTSNSRIISRAVAPLKSNGPSGLIVLAAAAVFGFALAAAGSVGWEMINGKLGSDRELVERTGVPLIARLSAPGSGKGTARLARFMPGETSATRTSERQLAVARVAYALRHAFAEERPANILVVSAGEEAALSPLVRAIASGLYDMGEEVLLARTDANAALSAPRREMLTTREPKRTRLSSRRRAGPALQEDGFAPAALRAGAAASPFTVERLDGHAHVPGDDQIGAGEDEFLLIDGGSALSNPYLPVLLGQSDAILLVTHLGQTSRFSPFVVRADTYDLWLRSVFAIVIAALVFNCFLAFVNTRVTGISASHVMLVEVLLIGVGFLLALDRRVDLYVVLTIYLTYMALILAMRPELDLKGIRDGLIPICFYFLGRGVRDIRSVDKLVLACAGIVIAVGLFEYFLLDIFLANININDYYIARGTINAGDNFTEGSDLFISGIRPEGRNFFPFLGIHRVSSVFLEPVSMGNFGAFLGMWALFRKDMARRKLLFAASATVIILGDARFGLFVCIAFFAAFLVYRFVPRVVWWLVPAMFALLLVLYGLSTTQVSWQDNLGGRCSA